MTVGERIKAVRELRGVTQEDLGKACNACKQTIYKYENNVVTNIPIDKLEQIASVLYVSPSYLMGWTENMVGTSVIGEFEKEFLEISKELPEEMKKSLLNLARMYVQDKEGK